MAKSKKIVSDSPRLNRFFNPDNKINTLRISIGIVYFWFGILKFFANVSPAELLAIDTLTTLSFHLIPAGICYLLLGLTETLIGVLLLSNKWISVTVSVGFLHMLGTFTPIVLQPHIFFTDAPFGITLTGQYIFKNIIIVSALLVIYQHESSTHQ